MNPSEDEFVVYNITGEYGPGRQVVARFAVGGVPVERRPDGERRPVDRVGGEARDPVSGSVTVACPRCGNHVSYSAGACWRCGKAF